MSDTFEVTWEADDGYVGRSRPHSFNIHADDIDPDDSEAALRKLFWDEIQRDFEDKVSYHSAEEEEFIEWAKTVQQERAAE